MACGYGLLAEDCGADHWAAPLNGRREGHGWRAPCPVCHAARALEFDVHGRGIRWNSFCADHDREALKPVLRQTLGDCLPGRPPRPTVTDPGLLAQLALSDLPPVALKVALLELSGMTRDEALDKLGVNRTNRYRIRTQLSQYGYNAAGQA